MLGTLGTGACQSFWITSQTFDQNYRVSNIKGAVLVSFDSCDGYQNLCKMGTKKKINAPEEEKDPEIMISKGHFLIPP